MPCKAKYEKRGGEVLLDAVADASVVPMLTEHPSVSLVPRADGHSLLCFDIDSLDDAGGAATAGPFAGVRLAAGLLVFDAFLTAVLQLPLTLVTLSGKKGVHAFVARSFPEADRRAVAEQLLPQTRADCRRVARAFAADVDALAPTLAAAMLWLDQLPLHGLDAAYVELLAAARAPTASNEDRFVAAFPLFDRQVTARGSLRVPYSVKREANATAVSRPVRIEALRAAARDGTPLPAPWSTPNALQRHATALKRAPDADELLALQEAATAAAAVAQVALPPPRSTAPPRKRARTWEHDAVVWVRALRPTPPPTALPACLRRLPDGGPMLTHLLEGVRRGGLAPSAWVAEDTVLHERLLGHCREPHLVPAGLPIALGALLGARLRHHARLPVMLSLLNSPFPDGRLLRRTRRLAGRKRLLKVVEGLAPSARQRARDARRAFGQRRNGALVRRGQRALATARSRPRRRRGGGAARGGRGARAGAGGGDGAGIGPGIGAGGPCVRRGVHRANRGPAAAAARRGRSGAPGLLAARPGASVDDAAARWATKGTRELGKLYAGGRTTIVLREFVDGAGRLGYDGDGVGRGIRSVMKEVRTAAFAYACSVDLSRAHLEALLQAWAAEVDAGGPAKDQRELRRLVEDRAAVEAELAADQARLSAGGPAQDHVGRMLEMPPKTLLSALVNKAPSSSFGPFHRAARVCRALGFARQAANRHPLVRAEPLRAPLTEPVRLGRAARVLERHAVGCIVDACAAAGLEPGLTLNDEVFAARAPTDAAAQAALLHNARARMRERLGFALPLRMQVF